MSTTPSRHPHSAEEQALATDLLLQIHDVMLRARCLDERLIRMNNLLQKTAAVNLHRVNALHGVEEEVPVAVVVVGCIGVVERIWKRD